MFDIGWAELMVIGSLALIVVGPRDLPKLLRSFGQYVGQARNMAREFQRSMEDAARDADISQMKGLRDTANELRSLNKLPFETVRPGSPKSDDLKPVDLRPAAAKPAAPVASPAVAKPAAPGPVSAAAPASSAASGGETA